MRIKDHGTSVLIWLSARDTYDWATRPNDKWPCSTLKGKRLFAAFDTNGLYDITISGKSNFECDAHELNAITSDYLKKELDKDHPCYFVTVGQFEGA